MARVTVEDCVDKVDNRFELVLLAGHRSRMISNGSPLTVDRDGQPMDLTVVSGDRNRYLKGPSLH